MHLSQKYYGNQLERNNGMEKFTPEQARKLAGLSQSLIAKKLNISENTYVKKEKGVSRFYIDEAYLLSEIVGINIEKIIFKNRRLKEDRET